ncbi:transducin beta-like protein 3 isoform X2 [Branchiostoma floridae]|uniref:Transducin beta-like protein 3 isoform X2 n=1 Tax=Branchiostoma floridae TaxID=7739 RepID=A0A9J7M8F1_BRAFL|nr:transducin beta-like protein 3 isoform X2 [Branchiostoma floridae]
MAVQVRKKNFAVQAKIEPFYTGGRVQLSADGRYLFCTCGSKVQVLEVQTGKVQTSIQQDDDDLSCFVVSPDDKHLVTAHRSLLLRQWDWTDTPPKCVRTWKAIHISPVSYMIFDTTSTLLATGGTDSTIKVWHVIQQYCTHNLKGCQGVVSVVAFHPDMTKAQVYGAASDYKIHVWDLNTSKCIALLDKHYSTVTSLQFTQDGNTLLSSGRDNIVSMWDITKFQVLKTIPVFESVESLVLLPEHQSFPNLCAQKEDGLHFVTAGSKGVLKVWNAQKSRCVFSHKRPSAGTSENQSKPDQSYLLTQTLLNTQTDTIATVTYDHNILFYRLQDFSLTKQFVGYNDEVLDIKFLGEDDSHIAVATNSEQVRVFNLATMDCQILYGHTDIVLSLSVFKKGQLFASSSKDNTVRLWRFDATSGKVRCVAMGTGHTHAVSAVTCARLKPVFVASVSVDTTLKLWAVPSQAELLAVEDTPIQLQATATERAHEKDINSISMSPNDKLLATGSQDRTIKLWRAPDLHVLGTLRGHKRGIWCVDFSPMDQVVASSSADGTMKIWSLTDFTCLKTFEGHDCSVMKVIFLSRGAQLLSSGSDGLIKLWTIKNNECDQTFDQHEDKIWALVSNSAETHVVSGAADSNIIMWKDVTEEEEQEEKTKTEDLILKEQELSNLIHEGRFLKAIGLAITLEQPYRVLTIVTDILKKPEGKSQLEKTLKKLREDQIDAVLKFVVQWNTNSRNCHQAQAVLSIILKNFPPDQLAQFPSIKTAIEGLVPYTERHFQRLNRLLQQAMFVEYTWQQMRTATEQGSTEPEESVSRHDTEDASMEDSSNGDVSLTSDSTGQELNKSSEQIQQTRPSPELRPKKQVEEVTISDSSSEKSFSDSSDAPVMIVDVQLKPATGNVTTQSGSPKDIGQSVGKKNSSQEDSSDEDWDAVLAAMRKSDANKTKGPAKGKTPAKQGQKKKMCPVKTPEYSNNKRRKSSSR